MNVSGRIRSIPAFQTVRDRKGGLVATVLWNWTLLASLKACKKAEAAIGSLLTAVENSQ